MIGENTLALGDPLVWASATPSTISPRASAFAEESQRSAVSSMNFGAQHIVEQVTDTAVEPHKQHRSARGRITSSAGARLS